MSHSDRVAYYEFQRRFPKFLSKPEVGSRIAAKAQRMSFGVRRTRSARGVHRTLAMTSSLPALVYGYCWLYLNKHDAFNVLKVPDCRLRDFIH